MAVDVERDRDRRMMRKLLVGVILAGALTGCSEKPYNSSGDDPPTRDQCFDSVEALHEVFIMRFDQLGEPVTGEHKWWEDWHTTIERLYELCHAAYPAEETVGGE
jgi:hypothetical protein